ncbi:MAG TPA: TolC family protein, partial [Flavipsychrobacter sp.]
MIRQKKYRYAGIILLASAMVGCNIPSLVDKKDITPPPARYSQAIESDSANIATLQWKEFFKDSYLVALIDTALKN